MTTQVSLALQGVIDNALCDREKLLLFATDCFKNVLEGFEIGFFLDQITHYRQALNRTEVLYALNRYPANTMHLVTRQGKPVKWSDLKDAVSLAKELFTAGCLRHLSFHLDMRQFFPLIQAAVDDKIPLLFENTDGNSKRGNSLTECQNALFQNPDWRIVLDYAHALEMEERTGIGPERFACELAPAVRQIHFSWPGNLYSEAQLGPDFNTRHSMMHLSGNSSLKRAGAFLRLTKPELVTIEGVVLPGEMGVRLVQNETNLVRSLLNDTEGTEHAVQPNAPESEAGVAD